MIKNTNNSPSLLGNLSDMLNQSHPLYRLADKIDRGNLSQPFNHCIVRTTAVPGKPIRLMCGLLILKHLRNLLDKSLVEQWSENAYYLYFLGCRSSLRLPRVPLQNLFISASVSVRRELNLSFRIRVNNEDREDHHNNTAFIDSIEINTSHGYQFSPFVFLGAGTGLHFMSSYKTGDMEIPLDVRDSKVDILVFANVRAHFCKGGSLRPYVSCRSFYS